LKAPIAVLTGSHSTISSCWLMIRPFRVNERA
jgi:hypothetical protein